MLKTNYGDLPVEIIDGRARVVRIGVDSDTRRNDRPTLGRERAVKGSEPVVQFPASSSTYASKTEAAYAQHLAALQHAGEIRAWWYQPFSFALSNGKRYRPDFVIEYPGGLERRPCCVEVKGWHANRRDSLTHLAWAADKFPFFFWVLVTRDKGQWIEKGIV